MRFKQPLSATFADFREPKSVIARAFQDGVDFLHSRIKDGVCKNSPCHRELRRIPPFTLPKNGKSRA
jgi:hypothetical protein